ncbi:hypothetical protein ACFLW0_06420 [Chloroflexota bacterium]
MQSQALHKLFNKIFIDEETKLQFISDPDSVITQFDLTEQEKRAVLITHAKLGLIDTNSPQLEATLKASYEWFAGPP